MSERSPIDPVSDGDLRRFREYVTAVLAGILLVGTIVLVGVALAASSAKGQDQFADVKDLLLFINPLVGVALGFYFNKSSTQTAVDTAEETARSASTHEQQAIRARTKAEAEAMQATDRAQQAAATLGEVSRAAEQYLAHMQREPGVLSEEAGASGDDATRQLEVALARANRFLMSE